MLDSLSGHFLWATCCDLFKPVIRVHVESFYYTTAEREKEEDLPE